MSTLPAIERNDVFELAFRFITETAENIFLTGKAGTGKTTFLKYLREHCTKNIVVAAPTGVAAINAGGVTLHSLFQLPFHPFLPTKTHRDELLGKLKYNRQRQQLLRKMELLVIDEISMVRCDVMDAIDTILRSVRRNFDTPFGGVQLLCIGDLHQLPPVAQGHEWAVLQEYYASSFFFDSMAVKEQTPLLIELNKIYRQKEESFVKLLNKVRTNNMDADDFEDLHQRYIPGFVPYPDEKYITLTSHNKQAELINNTEIERLHTPPFIYAAEVADDFAEHLYPADAQLLLKVGAQVMFLKNDPVLKRYFNGKIGVVRTLEKEKIIVDCDGDLIEVFQETWENSRYTLSRADGKLEQELLGTFTQYPLRLAWAITIHKSQGLTFEKVMIDAGAAFSSGQVYVALSRCTSLGGIVLLSKIPASAILSSDNVIKGQQSLTHKGSLAERFEGARQVFTQQLLEEIFSFHAAADAVHVLKFHIDMQADKLNAGAKEWIADLQQKLNGEMVTGAKFIRQIYTLMKDEPVIEKNTVLQERISAAANHFIPNISAMLDAVRHQPLVTEHKEAAEIVNEHLMAAALALFSSNYYLEYCRSPFSVTTFLQHKLNFAQPRLNISCYASGKKQVYTDVEHQELFDTLKRWRDMIVSETGQPIFMVVSHAGLKDICTFLPKTKRDLLLINGFGKAKVDKYGDDIIEVVQDYCERKNISSPEMLIPVNAKRERKPKAVAEPKEIKIPSKEITFDLFKAKKNIDEVAKERNLATSTVESHLSSYIQTGELQIGDLMPAEKYEQIIAVIKDRGETSLTDLKPLLPAGYTFGDMRMAEAAYKFREGVREGAED